MSPGLDSLHTNLLETNIQFLYLLPLFCDIMTGLLSGVKTIGVPSHKGAVEKYLLDEQYSSTVRCLSQFPIGFRSEQEL